MKKKNREDPSSWSDCYGVMGGVKKEKRSEEEREKCQTLGQASR
jgi:hypothetical protein